MICANTYQRFLMSTRAAPDLLVQLQRLLPVAQSFLQPRLAQQQHPSACLSLSHLLVQLQHLLSVAEAFLPTCRKTLTGQMVYVTMCKHRSAAPHLLVQLQRLLPVAEALLQPRLAQQQPYVARVARSSLAEQRQRSKRLVQARADLGQLVRQHQHVLQQHRHIGIHNMLHSNKSANPIHLH
jgi:hypothetical protein